MQEQTHTFSAARSWPASLHCAFGREGERTVLRHLRFAGPLRIQRLFYPEKTPAPKTALPCHCYLLHPPGGLVSGDSLDIRCFVEPGAHCLMTTPAAGKIYRTDSHRVAQRQSYAAALEDGILEYLPQETIFFNGAGARMDTEFLLKGQSRLIGWDITCLGRQAAGESFIEGRLTQRTRIVRNGVTLLCDRMDMEGGDEWLLNPAGLHGHTATAVFFACGSENDTDDDVALRLACERLQKEYQTSSSGASSTTFSRGKIGVTCRRGLLLARCLSEDSAEAKRFCFHAWEVTRPLLLRRAASPPRKWNL